jgi:hypothetical protein
VSGDAFVLFSTLPAFRWERFFLLETEFPGSVSSQTAVWERSGKYLIEERREEIYKNYSDSLQKLKNEKFEFNLQVKGQTRCGHFNSIRQIVSNIIQRRFFIFQYP